MAVVTGTNWNAYDAATMTSREIYGRTLAELGKHNEKIVGDKELSEVKETIASLDSAIKAS